MQFFGFLDSDVTKAGADGGLDVVASGAVAQVKAEGYATGSEPVQRLAGAALAGHGDAEKLFFTSFGYTAQARMFADKARVALFQYSFIGEVTPVNGAAEQIVKRAEDRIAALALKRSPRRAA